MKSTTILRAAAIALLSSASLGCVVDIAEPQDLQVNDPDAPQDADDADDAGEDVAEAGSELMVECRIQPFGDSLTAGYPPGLLPAHGGYRDDLVNIQPAVGAPIRMVGTQSSYSPAWLWPLGQQLHSGYPAFTTELLIGQVPLNLVAPNVILVHAGTNDILNWQGHLNAAGDLNVLVRTLLFHNPTARILVAKIIPLAGIYAGFNGEIAAFNTHVGALVAQLNLEGWSKVHVVDMNTGFPIWSLAVDGIHPTDDGYAWMASKWREKLNQVGCL